MDLFPCFVRWFDGRPASSLSGFIIFDLSVSVTVCSDYIACLMNTPFPKKGLDLFLFWPGTYLSLLIVSHQKQCVLLSATSSSSSLPL